MIAVHVVDANLDFQLWLSPETGAVGWRQPDTGVELSRLELAVFAEQLNPGFVVRIFPKVIVGDKLEADFPGAGHLVFGLKHQPTAAGTDAVLFALIGTHCALLGQHSDSRRAGQKQASQRGFRERDQVGSTQEHQAAHSHPPHVHL
jgi:hypothetical protein